jgi:putative hemolysin
MATPGDIDRFLAALRIIRDSGHSRFPVYGQTSDDIVGFVYARDIYEAALHDNPLEVSKLVRNTLVVPENKALCPSTS